LLKVFDKNLTPVGVLPDAYDVERKRRLNSDYELSFLVPMISDDYKEKITLKGHVQDERGQYYVINSRKRVREGLKRTAAISCMHVMFKLSDFLMPYDSYMEEGYGVNILTLTNAITDATKGKFLFVLDDVFELKDVKDFGRGNALQALNYVLKTYGAEVDPNNFVIHLKKKIGSDRGLQYRYKKNIIGSSYEDDSRSLVTRMFSQMKDGLSFIGLPASNLTAEEYNLLNAVPGAIVNGEIRVNYLISPYWSYWSNSTNKYFDGELIDQDLEEPLELLEATRKALKEQEAPILNVDINAADLHKIDPDEPPPALGDTVYMIDPDLELNNLTARIVDITEYPFAPDKHTKATLANVMKRDFEDIIADLDRAKRIVNDIISGGNVRTTVFEAFAKQAIYDVNNSKTEVKYDQRGIVLQDKTNIQNQVVMSSNGIYLTTDGGVTPRAAVTANGVVAEVIVGLLGQFVQLRANQIVVGDSGEKIADGLLQSAANWNGKTTLLTGSGIYTGTLTTNQLIAGSAKITSALIESIKANQIDVTGGKITASQFEIKGTSVSNGSQTTFAVDSGGNVTVAGNITMLGGHISWGSINSDPVATNAQSVANGAQSTANGAVSIAQAIANGTYSGGTFISGSQIYSPTVTGGIIQTSAVGRRIELSGSQLKSLNTNTQDGFTLDGSTGYLQWYSNGSIMGGIYKNFSGSSEQLVFGHNLLAAVVSNNRVDIQAPTVAIGSGFSGANVQFFNNVNFLGTVSGLSTNSIPGLEARLKFLEDRAFIRSYHEGYTIFFDSKNIPKVDYVTDLT
jgi:phage minor structural protein